MENSSLDSRDVEVSSTRGSVNMESRKILERYNNLVSWLSNIAGIGNSVLASRRAHVRSCAAAIAESNEFETDILKCAGYQATVSAMRSESVSVAHTR